MKLAPASLGTTLLRISTAGLAPGMAGYIVLKSLQSSACSCFPSLQLRTDSIFAISWLTCTLGSRTVDHDCISLNLGWTATLHPGCTCGKMPDSIACTGHESSCGRFCMPKRSLKMFVHLMHQSTCSAGTKAWSFLTICSSSTGVVCDAGTCKQEQDRHVSV